MKTKWIAFFALTLCLTVSGSAWAQITLTSANFPAVGTTVLNYETTDVVNFSLGSGANQTWNFSSYTYASSGATAFQDPDNTPFGSNFPTATHATNDAASGDGYLYLRLASNACYSVGTASVVEGDTMIWTYDPEGMIAAFPITYQTTWTSVSRYTFEPIPGFSMTITDSAIYLVDGWGTLITPAGSASALRLRDHSFFTTEMTGIPPSITESYGYSFLTQSGFMGATVSSDSEDPDPNFTSGYVTYSTLGQTAVDPVRGPVAERFAVNQNYPNPFNPTTNLPVEISQAGHVNVTIYDETGRTVSQEQFDLNPGHHDLSINGSAWSTGTYFARVSAGNNSQTVKMHLIK